METKIDLNSPEILAKIQDICNRNSDLYHNSKYMPGLAYILEAYSTVAAGTEKLTLDEMLAVLAVELDAGMFKMVERTLDTIHNVFFYYHPGTANGDSQYDIRMFPVLQVILRSYGLYYNV